METTETAMLMFWMAQRKAAKIREHLITESDLLRRRHLEEALAVEERKLLHRANAAG